MPLSPADFQTIRDACAADAVKEQPPKRHLLLAMVQLAEALGAVDKAAQAEAKKPVPCPYCAKAGVAAETALISPTWRRCTNGHGFPAPKPDPKQKKERSNGIHADPGAADRARDVRA